MESGGLVAPFVLTFEGCGSVGEQEGDKRCA